MLTEIKHVINNILDKVYPCDMTCFVCGREIKDDNCVCGKCNGEMPWNTKICLKCGSPCRTMSDYCLNCQKYKKIFNLARAPFIYSGSIAMTVQDFKYNGDKYLAQPFAKAMKDEYEKMVANGMQVDFIVYVPLFSEKQKKRGYNQSELLAVELSKLIKVPVVHNNLIRIKNTETQTNLSYKERQTNLDKAFYIKDKTMFKNKNILLIDDVLTTGSTANHCSQALKKARAKNIYVLTLATTDGE